MTLKLTNEDLRIRFSLEELNSFCKNKEATLDWIFGGVARTQVSFKVELGSSFGMDTRVESNGSVLLNITLPETEVESLRLVDAVNANKNDLKRPFIVAEDQESSLKRVVVELDIFSIKPRKIRETVLRA